MFGLIEETEDHIIEYIANMTGIKITRANLAPEIRIAQIKQDLLEEYNANTEHS